MARPPKRRGASQRYTSPEFRPYVIALGQLALAWNDLQESLAALFWSLMNPPPMEGDTVNYTPLHVWASIKSDRTQREMLKAISKHPPTFWNRPEINTDVCWLVNRASELENLRNDAIHSPLFSVSKSIYGGFDLNPREKVAPAYWLFNPRAINLSKRENLLTEFRYCRDLAITLADYAQLIDRSLINQRGAWPNRPPLPNRAEKSSQPHKSAHPPKRQPKSQPRSSRA
jgi:hypothetical protein